MRISLGSAWPSEGKWLSRRKFQRLEYFRHIWETWWFQTSISECQYTAWNGIYKLLSSTQFIRGTKLIRGQHFQFHAIEGSRFPNRIWKIQCNVVFRTRKMHRWGSNYLLSILNLRFQGLKTTIHSPCHVPDVKGFIHVELSIHTNANRLMHIISPFHRLRTGRDPLKVTAQRNTEKGCTAISLYLSRITTGTSNSTHVVFFPDLLRIAPNTPVSLRCSAFIRFLSAIPYRETRDATKPEDNVFSALPQTPCPNLNCLQ